MKSIFNLVISIFLLCLGSTYAQVDRVALVQERMILHSKVNELNIVLENDNILAFSRRLKQEQLEKFEARLTQIDLLIGAPARSLERIKNFECNGHIINDEHLICNDGSVWTKKVNTHFDGNEVINNSSRNNESELINGEDTSTSNSSERAIER